MFNAQQVFAAAKASIPAAEFNVARLSSTIKDADELFTACVYDAFIEAVKDSSLDRREKSAIRDEINPTIYGESPFDERKTIPLISAAPFLKRAQIAKIAEIVNAAVAA